MTYARDICDYALNDDANVVRNCKYMFATSNQEIYAAFDFWRYFRSLGFGF